LLSKSLQLALKEPSACSRGAFSARSSASNRDAIVANKKPGGARRDRTADLAPDLEGARKIRSDGKSVNPFLEIFCKITPV